MTTARAWLPIALLTLAAPAAAAPAKRKEVTFKAKDGLKVTADLYAVRNKKAPVLVLCHMARASRGEYRTIGPRLRAEGFNCLALDQRSGKKWKGVVNKTARRARKAKKATGYLDARQDIAAAITWLRKKGYSGKLVLWGSSYSASLALVMAAARDDVHAVLAFSPGEHLKPRGLVAKAAKRLENTPVFMAGPLREKAAIIGIFEALSGGMKQYTMDPGIVHGSRTLDDGSYKGLWKYGVSPFLKEFVLRYKKPARAKRKPRPRPAAR